MNVVKIMGGLGNQLFQYAFIKSLEKYDEIGLDISYYDSYFNHSEDIAHRDYLLPYFADGLEYSGQGSRTRVNQWEYNKDQEYREAYFFGDWQRMSFFDGLDLKIRQKDGHITDDSKEFAEKMQNENSVAIHVRRTDYLKFGWELDMGYYKRAIDTIQEHYPDAVFYLFSDAPSWASYNLPQVGAAVIKSDTLNDFYLMSKCKNIIIANSSFSFWAAYLNENPEKMIIYPAEWKCCPNPVDIQRKGWVKV